MGTENVVYGIKTQKEEISSHKNAQTFNVHCSRVTSFAPPPLPMESIRTKANNVNKT